MAFSRDEIRATYRTGAERHPWESLRNHLDHFEMSEHYFGYTYVACGEKTKA